MNDFIIILGVIIVLIINELFVFYLFKKHPKLIYKLYEEEAKIILKNFKEDLR